MHGGLSHFIEELALILLKGITELVFLDHSFSMVMFNQSTDFDEKFFMLAS